MMEFDFDNKVVFSDPETQQEQRLIRGGKKLVKCTSTLLCDCDHCDGDGEPLPCEYDGREILLIFPCLDNLQNKHKSLLKTSRSVYGRLRRKGIPEDKLCVATVLACYHEITPSMDVTKLRYEQCSKHLNDLIRDMNPRIIIPVGPVATGAVLRLYRPDHYAKNHTVANIYGQVIPLYSKEPLSNGIKWDSWLAPLPSDEELRVLGYTDTSDNDKLNLLNTKMDGLIDYLLGYYYHPSEMVCDTKGDALIRQATLNPPSPVLLLDESEIVTALESIEETDIVAFDYETSTLDPETTDAEIITASICVMSKGTIYAPMAFSFEGSEKVATAWKRFLRSVNKKIGANIKFEHRWSSVYYGVEVYNWYWDVCVGARRLNCQAGCSGLKYITFCYFGEIGYDDEVHKFMTEDANGLNQLKTMDRIKLLTYNALDSYYTMVAWVYQRQLLR